MSTTQNTFAFKPKASLETRQGNLSAMVYVLGRNAAIDGKCIFDCPYEAGSDKAELWMDGYMFEDKKKALLFLTGQKQQ